MTGIFQITGVNFCLKGLPILENIDFPVKKGEFISLVGPLGCGKTTLLKIIAGLQQPSRGKIIFDKKFGKNPYKYLSFVFQQKNLVPWRTVWQNISLPLEIANLPQPEITRQTRKLIKQVSLEKFSHYYPKQLSEGMKQLVAIARSFAHNSQILLWDEPFASLDPLTREAMNQKILNFCQRDNRTIILTTHSPEEAVFLSDKIIILSRRPGKIKKIIQVNLPRPRKNYMIYESAFLAQVNKIKKTIEAI